MITIECENKTESAMLYWLLTSVGFSVKAEYVNGIIYVKASPDQQSHWDSTVVSVELIQNCEQYVYDIETDCGWFNGGVGQITLKNTDSVYFRPRLEVYGKYAKNMVMDLQSIIDVAFKIADGFKDQINHDIGLQTFDILRMEFEELLCPSIFTGKKKYAGLVYESKSKVVKKSAVQCDILLRGIDFIKSQYPQLIKELGYRTIIDIVNHFNDKLQTTHNSNQIR